MNATGTPAAAHRAIIEDRRRRLSEWCAATLDRPEPIVLEIGSGHGHFLTAYAAAHPDRVCLGVDLLLERVERAHRKRERAGLPNLFFVRADVEDLLAVLPPAIRLSEIFILFPDPWPKRRHHKHRLLSAALLDRLAELAPPGSKLYLRTDHAGYFADARRAIEAAERWRIIPGVWPFELETVFQSRAPRFDSLIARRA